ncbi:MAG: hypothetical protein OHK0015_10620 [Chloroflexi bacterium OHK40]
MNDRHAGSHRRPPLIAGMVVLLAGLLATCPLSLLAVRHGMLRPPVFAVTVGDYELAAPCPPHFGCDSSVPYYALWRGERQPDGSINYHLLYFTYLPPARSNG